MASPAIRFGLASGRLRELIRRQRENPSRATSIISSATRFPLSTCKAAYVSETSGSVARKPLDLLYARTAAGTTETFELIDFQNGKEITALWKGKTVRLVAAADGGWTAQEIGSYPQEDSELVRSFPSLKGQLLAELRSHAGTPPSNITSLTHAYSLSQLEDAAAVDASLWCDGTKPGAPEKTALQSQTLTAGELVSLIQGKRGVVVVQLWNGFEPSRGQPLYDPWVIHLLEAALRTPGIRALPSVAPGGVGLTAVLFADREPWSAWGPHLASFGCQANAVAGSAYYKVLIGKILGYKDENIFGYVRAVGGGLTPAVVAQVEADLKKLSKAKPKLPWNREGSRGKKAPSGAAAAAAAGGSGSAAAGGGAGQRRSGGNRAGGRK